MMKIGKIATSKESLTNMMNQQDMILVKDYDYI
jgi:hypothetical protein